MLVGSETFHLHPSVLSKSSEFLAKAMKPEWRSDPSKPITLSEVDPELFGSYCQWLYAQQLVFKGTVSASFEHLAKLYVLGEHLLDAAFRNTIIDALIKHCQTTKKFPPDTAVQIIYQGTPTGSPARKLLVDFWAHAASRDWSRTTGLVALTSVDFAEALINALLEVREKPDSTNPRLWLKQPNSYYVEPLQK